jgi:hypothetical protein
LLIGLEKDYHAYTDKVVNLLSIWDYYVDTVSLKGFGFLGARGIMEYKNRSEYLIIYKLGNRIRYPPIQLPIKASSIIIRPTRMSKQKYNPQILWPTQQNVSKWGNLTGKTSEQAKAQILKNNPGLNVIIQP